MKFKNTPQTLLVGTPKFFITNGCKLKGAQIITWKVSEVKCYCWLRRFDTSGGGGVELKSNMGGKAHKLNKCRRSAQSKRAPKYYGLLYVPGSTTSAVRRCSHFSSQRTVPRQSGVRRPTHTSFLLFFLRACSREKKNLLLDFECCTLQ